MGFSYFDYEKKRYWMGAGNVRTCRELEELIEHNKRDKKVLSDFLERNAVSVTKTAESEFVHPFEQRFPAEQRGPGYEGVPEKSFVEGEDSGDVQVGREPREEKKEKR